jgi:hypothetical protein
MGTFLGRPSVRTAILMISFLTGTTQAEGQAKGWPANVAQDHLEVFREMSPASPIVAILRQGQSVTVVLKIHGQAQDWCRLRTGTQDYVLGYVACSGLQQGTAKALKEENISNIAGAGVVTPESSNLRSSSGRSPFLSTDQTAILTNWDVLALTKVGLTADALVLKIKSSSCRFDTSPAALQELKIKQVPDSVVVAMLEAPKPTSTPLNSATTVTSSVLPSASLNPRASIPRGSRVFIEPMDGFESFLAAALQKKKVSLVVVDDEKLADFIINGGSDSRKAGWAKIIFMGNLHSDEEASITMVDVKTDTVAFAYAVNKKSTLHGEQTTAEACAKHLKGRMEGRE